MLVSGVAGVGGTVDTRSTSTLGTLLRGNERIGRTLKRWEKEEAFVGAVRISAKDPCSVVVRENVLSGYNRVVGGLSGTRGVAVMASAGITPLCG